MRCCESVWKRHCRDLGIPCIAILDPVLASLRNYLGTHEHVEKPGIQHELDAEYFKRIEALTLHHGP